MTVSFKVTKRESQLIRKIMRRFRMVMEDSGEIFPWIEYEMSLTACHANGTPIKLVELSLASDFDVMHDVCGIHRHIDKATGEIRDCFVPRFVNMERQKSGAS